MITRETKIDVCDNSGAQIVRCIGFFKNIKTHFVGINEVVVVCLKKFSRKKFYTTRIKKKGGQTAKKKSKLPSLQIKERLIYLGIIITTKKPWIRIDGRYIKTKHNRVCLLNTAWKFIGNKIIGPVTKEIRKKKKIPIFKTLNSFAKRRI